MTPFIITCAARTGSTMLRYMLDSHPEITCHGEVFKARGISRFLKADKRPYGLSPLYDHLSDEFRGSRVVDFIPNHLLQGPDANTKASGFKFKTDEYFNTSFTEVSNYIQSNKSIKVIHLKRKDLLAQYVSHLMVKEKKSKTVEFNASMNASNNGSIAPTKMSTDRLMDFMEDVVSREVKIVEELGGHESLEVFYEDIIESAGQCLKELQFFLNVSLQTLQVKTQKILSEYQSLIKNKSEVITALQSSKFSTRFDLPQG